MAADSKLIAQSEAPRAAHTARAIAEKLSAKLIGDGDKTLSGIKPLESAGPNDLSFLQPTSRGKRAELYELAVQSKAGALLVAEEDPTIKVTQIVTPNPLAAVIGLSALFYQPPAPFSGRHPQAAIHESARLGENVSVGAFAVIGEGAKVGKNSVIHPHVVFYPGAQIGENCIIHAGAILREFVRLGNDCIVQNGVVVGGDGFGYHYVKDRGHQRIPHIGSVVIEDGVDLGANTTIDRAMLGETRIGANTKIDNLVMVGHNVQIGKETLLCAQVGVSGSTKIGSNVTLAGQVGVADHVTIGDRVRAAGQTGVAGDIPAGTDVGGTPHTEALAWKKLSLYMNRLPELFKRIQRLEKKYDE